MTLKGLFRRQRPPGSANRPYLGPDAHSFPSGHACRAMAIATALSPLVEPVVRPFLFLWAVLVGLSRVALGVHHLSDVVVGLLVGWGIGLLHRPGRAGGG
ncbi:MAG: phosphatase PAP2 family protein [Chloroflexi bacterium]|nr:MAG: phosphatase PAP2 family protein [Chloroflexota bacterium]